jgi:PKD domain/Bacterial Ig-like domain (group 1)
MLAHSRHARPIRRLALVPFVIAFIGLLAFSSACDKVPLTAPGGTVITLFATANSVPLNGEMEIIATAIENGTTQSSPTTPTTPTNPSTPTTPTTPTSTSSTGAGTPVQNGTLITFTTTLGRIEPADARTTNGQVRVRFITGAQSGTATITAFSGGASGKLENLKVGTAAVERVTVTANPGTLGAQGGSTELSARVEDVSGAPVVGVSVTFTTTQGNFSVNPATTDASGLAKTTLTTTREANVNATVGGKSMATALTISLSPRTGITISPPTSTTGSTTLAAGAPVTFTVGVATGTAGSVIRDVTVDFGDGDRRSLGALNTSSVPVQHTYLTEGTYRATATATDASGFTESVSTIVTILPAQPPSVVVNPSNSRPAINETVILTASVSGATSSILRYDWNFGADATSPPISTTGNQAPTAWTRSGSKVITVTVIQSTGPSGNGFGTVVVQTGTTVSSTAKH